MLRQKNAAHLYKAVQQNQDNENRLRALNDSATFMKIAAEQGHHLDANHLEAELEQLSEEEIAAIFNPGLSPRKHLIRKYGRFYSSNSRGRNALLEFQ